jgi:hypothetical protein
MAAAVAAMESIAVHGNVGRTMLKQNLGPHRALSRAFSIEGLAGNTGLVSETCRRKKTLSALSAILSAFRLIGFFRNN